MPQSEDYFVAGRISGLYGVRGWLRIYAYTTPRENILDYSEWVLRAADGSEQRWLLEQGAQHGKGVVAKLRGCDDRDLAATLLQREIYIKTALLPVLAQGEYYWNQLIGLQVEDSNGTHLGRIDALMETGANDVLIVQGDEGAELLIPYIPDEVVTSIDLTQGRMVVNWDPDY
jgi:16S rRNA processing protein RimM